MNIVDRQTGKQLKSLHSDGGGEYIDSTFQFFLNALGTRSELKSPYMPRKNRIAEQMNRTLMEIVRVMLKHNGVSKKNCADAAVTATYIRNRVEIRDDSGNKATIKVEYGFQSAVGQLRMYGLECPYHCRKENSRKMGDRGNLKILIGYSADKKA